jgi:nitrogen fixation protein FixH
MSTTIWRWSPHGLIATMGLVFLVNGYMVYDAYSTFPGISGKDGFDVSNEYKRVLETAQQQAALGWQLEAGLADDRFPVLRLTGRTGAPLTASRIDAQAERPVGPVDATALAFRSIGDGRYQSETSLYSGQWDIMLTVQTDGSEYRATRRLAVK